MPTLRRVLIVLILWNGAAWLVLGPLLAPVVPGGWAAIVLAAALLLLPVRTLARGFTGRLYPSAATRLWVYRPFWYGQLLLPLLALAGLAGVLVGLPLGASGTVGRTAVGGAAAALALLGVAGYLGTRRLVVRPLEVALPGLPPGLEGLRIAQLSDLHVGPHTSRRHLARVREAVRRAEPELIAVTGDQVDDYPRDTEPLGEALGALRAPLGIFAVAGNHDVYAGWDAVRAGMERLGWTVLVNDAVRLERGGAAFWLAGTGDPAARAGSGAAPDLGRTLRRIPPGAFTVALAHNPVLWPPLAERGVALTLSGHTHHGQLSVPRLGWSLASVFLEHSMGLYRAGTSVLYINPGTNFWGIPFRVGALPEVTVLTLRRAPAEGGTAPEPR